ncbi:hypothetical protein [Polyangium spumosum]|uniref:Uncharacterized protein n=1 Tax=Polyangium spumosum TaxID=889282 RepID=A0A6N7PQ27_9BACT|nr:hypothetical protein [Polyangium spumosum]MRG92305.1 hypothetical protein [Polyangium spumosum]
MNAPLIVTNTLPSKSFNTITQLGLKALNLALVHNAALGPRLPQGLVDGLIIDIEKLGEAVPGAKFAQGEAVAATSAQNVALESGHAQVKQIRAAIRRAKAPVDVKRAYGIGQKVNKTNVRDVQVAIQHILERAEKAPDEATSLGIVPKDIAKLKQSLAAITQADAQQEQKRATAPGTTRARNRTANRILAAVARIEGAGRIEFEDDPAILAEFEALGAGTRGKKKGDAENEEGEADPAG